MKLRIGAIGALFAAAVVIAAPTFEEAGRRWWSHVEFLASDKLEGRDTGSPGHRKAAEYVAGEFEKAGLRPAGTDGYIQPVSLEVRKLDEPGSSLELVRDGKVRKLALGEEAILSMRVAPATDLEAPLYFAGYGFAVPEAKYDDLAGDELRGKIIVTIQGAPAGIPGPLQSHYQSNAERRVFLQKAGVVGQVTIFNPKLLEAPWSRIALSRFMPSMSLSDPALNDGGPLRLSVAANPEKAGVWFEGSGHRLDELLALAADGKPLPRFALAGKLRSHASVVRSKVESQNVAGVLTGSDPKLKNEYVVLSAHLDHVGVGEAINGDKIYNGAMDNATGIASLIEMARMLKQSGRTPRRSVLFVAVTGEEKGLLGSRYYAGHPTVPAKAMVADINFDMFLPIIPLKVLTAYGEKESDLGDLLRSLAKPMGIEIQDDPEPARNIFVRSDQYNFVRLGVPSLFVGFGFHKGTPEEKTFMDWLHQRYHAPSDDTTQPVDLQAAAKFNELMLRVVRAVGDQDGRPQWKPESFFRRFAN
jgi:hypothetical protein